MFLLHVEREDYAQQWDFIDTSINQFFINTFCKLPWIHVQENILRYKLVCDWSVRLQLEFEIEQNKAVCVLVLYFPLLNTLKEIRNLNTSGLLDRPNQSWLEVQALWRLAALHRYGATMLRSYNATVLRCWWNIGWLFLLKLTKLLSLVFIEVSLLYERVN